MEKAFILISCDVGSENELFIKLNEIDCVSSTTITYGEYDLVVEVETETPQKMDEFVTSKIRKFQKIRSTITLRVTA
ncbi:AsnC family transcriptional regulator [Nitrosopumilus sp. b1]|uniref:Lrp/AsnC ligand binding domain-containing protein n=1 Tax=Nitrosopumilus sp. b1 TaxID=2109907 RepID=UPI0015F454B2|nr:Lrp/AsnC ligand binding domain-containing protein [Nitrosopumilus sp. b1]KAF6243675.1 AsnC family transcriptional regulator [Nitrosopumilus sp. b1]